MRPRARLGIVTEVFNKPAPTGVPGLAVCGRTTKRYRLSPFIIHLDKSLRRLFVDYENDITLFFLLFCLRLNTIDVTDENLVAVSFTQREAKEEEEKRPDPNNNKSAVITITNQSDILRSREDRRELIESDERNVKSGKQTTNTHLVTNQNNVASLFSAAARVRFCHIIPVIVYLSTFFVTHTKLCVSGS